jgi:hypothetical protein
MTCQGTAIAPNHFGSSLPTQLNRTKFSRITIEASRSGSYPDSPELPDREILQSVRKIPDKIEVREKEWTSGMIKKYSTVKTKVVTGRLAVDLLNQFHAFKGCDIFQLERALRLYVKVMQASSCNYIRNLDRPSSTT